MAELSTKIAKFCTIQKFPAIWYLFNLTLPFHTQIKFFFLHACTLILAARPPISSRCCFWECAGRSLILEFPYNLSNSFLSYFVPLSFCILFLSFLPSPSSSLPFLMMSLTLILLSLSCFPSEQKKIFVHPFSFLQLG